jgi:hypothetical protein
MRTGIEGRRVREASRQLNTYVTLAKSLAAETGRPSGLIIETEGLIDPVTNQTVPLASRLYVAETPPPYAGDLIGARAKVVGNVVTFVDPPWILVTDNQSIGMVGIQAGDFIKFDYKAPMYRIDLPDSITGPANQVTISGSPLPPDGRYPYQIFRQPKKSSSTPLELIDGAIIDLANSGFGLTDNRFSTADGPITVVFGTSGEVTRVFFRTSDPLVPLVDVTPTETIHLLIGEVDGVFKENSTDTYNRNLLDADNRWVSIGHQTGKVSTAENAATPSNATLSAAREFAQSAQSMGGR